MARKPDPAPICEVCRSRVGRRLSGTDSTGGSPGPCRSDFPTALLMDYIMTLLPASISANWCSNVRVSREIRQICQHRRQVSRHIRQKNHADMQISPNICRICRSVSHVYATSAQRRLKLHGNKAVPALLGWVRWLGLGWLGWLG